MKITVGGSFHGEGWTEVVRTADKLRRAGHIILAPGEEWTPINVEDKFVRFKGQEGMNSVELQRNFLESMKQSEVYIIVDYKGYIGQTVACELGYAAALCENSSLKKIYLTEAPVCYDIFRGEIPSPEQFTQRLFLDPNFRNIFDSFKKSSGTYFKSPEEFYWECSNIYGQIASLERSNFLEIGINQLLTKSQEFDEEER